MQKIKAVLFDVIGTTVLEKDTETINRCFQTAFEQHDLPILKSDIAAVRGKDKFEAIQDLLRLSGNPQGLAIGVFESFKTNVTSELSNFMEHPELDRVVAHLKACNVKIGIGSGLPVSVFETLFQHLDWKKHEFDYIGVFEKFKVGRPAPIMLIEMSSLLKVPMSQILKVGDTVADVEEGKNAKALTAAVLSGTQHSNLLIESKPDYILYSLSDVISIMD